MKIFGPGSHPGGGVTMGIYPGDKNGIGENMEVGCGPGISVRGGVKVLPRYRCLGLWLTVRTRAGPGAGGWSWRWALGLGQAGQQQQGAGQGKPGQAEEEQGHGQGTQYPYGTA